MPTIYISQTESYGNNICSNWHAVIKLTYLLTMKLHLYEDEVKIFKVTSLFCNNEVTSLAIMLLYSTIHQVDLG